MRLPRPRFSILTLLAIVAVIAVGLAIWERWIAWPASQAKFTEILQTNKPQPNVLNTAQSLVRRYPSLARQEGAMTWAVLNGDVATCRVFLDAGGKLVEERDDVDPSMPLLYLPVSLGEVEKVELLIQRGAQADAPFDLDFFSQRDLTFLETAASFGHTEMCRVLLESGADVNHQSADGDTALHAAVGCFSPETVQLLLEHHAVCLKNQQGLSPLTIAQSLQEHFAESGVTNRAIEKIVQQLEEHEKQKRLDQAVDSPP